MSIHSRFDAIMKQHLSRKAILVAAISGGCDSMALLGLLKASGYKKIVVAHLNHMIRRDSRLDEKLVEKIAKKYGYAFESAAAPVVLKSRQSKVGLEEAARKERYAFLEKLRKKYDAGYICTAHHRDDQAETILLNFIRGSGIRGLVGMKTVSGNILRPLLDFPKEELLAFCRKKKIPWREDSTNRHLEYSRNRIRLKIVPEILHLNQNFTETLRGTSAICQEIQSMLDAAALDFISSCPRERWELKSFFRKPKAIQNEILRKLYETYNGSLLNFSFRHMEEIMKMLRTPGNKKKEFGKKYFIQKTAYYFTVICR